MASAAERAGAFVRELRRRRVFRVAGASLATGLGFVYAADVILPRLDAPEWTVSLVIMLAGLGFFLAVGLAWAFDVTSEGVVRTPPAEPLSATVPETEGHDAGPQPDRRAIAVLPFENMSDDAGTEYFSDGISEEIINALAQLPELRVAGRTSAFSFKGRHEDLRTVGRKLNVGTVLEGSVRRAGDRVRITAQLIDTTDGYHLWSERYDRDLHDIFAVQDEIARAIADRLAVKLGARASTSLIAQHPDDPQAYALFLQGRHHVAQTTEAGFARGIDAYQQAIARVPDYALAYAAMAEAEIMRGVVFDEPYAGSPSRARAAALKAIELDDRMAEAHSALGAVQTYYDLDWTGAERSFKRAIELNPGSPWAHTWYGDLLAYSGRSGEAIDAARRAMVIEPLSPIIRWNVIQNLWLGGQLDESEREARTAMELFPDAFFPAYFLGMIGWSRGDEGEAVAGVEAAIQCVGRATLLVANLAAICYNFGLRERGDTLFDEVRRVAQDGHVSGGAFVLIHLARGETGEAVEWLRRGRANRDGFFSQLKAITRAVPLPFPAELAAEFDRLGFP